MFATEAEACVLAKFRSASRSWDSCCVDKVPVPVRDIGSCQRCVSFRHIHGLRRYPVEQGEISAPHGTMGKLLSLQPLLQSHDHRTGLRTIGKTANLRKRHAAPPRIWGAALFVGITLHEVSQSRLAYGQKYRVAFNRSDRFHRLHVVCSIMRGSQRGCRVLMREDNSAAL